MNKTPAAAASKPKQCKVCGGWVRYPYGFHGEDVTCSRMCDEILEISIKNPPNTDWGKKLEDYLLD